MRLIQKCRVFEQANIEPIKAKPLKMIDQIEAGDYETSGEALEALPKWKVLLEMQCLKVAVAGLLMLKP